jgi:site-specific recombinase XerC
VTTSALLPRSASNALLVAAHIEQLGQRLAKPSVKQHLAAIRMLFDWLVVGQLVASNPAAPVYGSKYTVRKPGHRP